MVTSSRIPGIAYAAAPVGGDRFALPRPLDHPARPVPEPACCMQVAAPPGVAAQRQSEHCLTLDVWSPDGAVGPLPVVVWVHGGAWRYGDAASLQAGELCSATGTVVVAVRYRLGPWGFAPLLPGEDARFAPNAGLADIVAALRWVRQEVASFGGDPSRVTVAGHGAGGGCVAALMAMPVAAALFHRVLLVSPELSLVESSVAAHAAVALADALDVDVRDLADALVDIDADRLASVAGGAEVTDGFGPRVDGTVLPREPLAAVAAGAAKGKSLLVTTCAYDVAAQAVVEPEQLAARVDRLRRRAGTVAWRRLQQVYRLTAGEGERWETSLASDGLSRVPAARFVAAHTAAGGHGWLGLFDHHPDGSPFDRLGACHGADVALMTADPTLLADRDRAACTTLRAMLACFAAAGDPDPAGGWPQWHERGRPVFLRTQAVAATGDTIDHRMEAWRGLPAG